MPALASSLDDLEMRVGRCQNGGSGDAAVIHDAFEAIGDGKGEAARQRPARRAALGVIAVGHLHTIPEVEQALGVRRHGHAEADDGDAMTAHAWVPLQRKC